MSKSWFLGIFAVLIIQGIFLYFFGQSIFCQCGYIKLWEGDVYSNGNSQHFSDWYTFSHIIHGFLFYALLSWVFPKVSIWKKLFIAVILESSWEILENTPMVIQHYRKQALAQGYIGDSIINSLSDSVFMILGFIVAKKIPAGIIVLFAIILEVLTAYIIRDNLTLNIINLLYPFPFIHNWQAGQL